MLLPILLLLILAVNCAINHTSPLLALQQPLFQSPPQVICTPYRGPLCSKLVNYPIPVANAQSAFIQQVESNFLLEETPQLVQSLQMLRFLYPKCADVFLRYLCGSAYPRCDEAEQIIRKPCPSMCEEVSRWCAIPFKQTGNLHLLSNCTNEKNLSTLGSIGNCFRTPGHLGSLVDESKNPCPMPLIEPPLEELHGTVKGTSTCFGRCCLPCPSLNTFYKAGTMDIVYKVAMYMHALSSLLSLFVTLSYALLPNKRQHPSIIVLFVGLAITLWMGNIWLSFPDPHRVQCASAIVDYVTAPNITIVVDNFSSSISRVTQADMNNNTLCSIQGTLLVFFTHLSVMWVAFLIVNLHLTAVWRSHFLEHHFYLASLLCWLDPLIFTLWAYFENDVQYTFGVTCLVGQESAEKLFFFPMMAIIFPSILLHLWTFVHIARVSMSESKESSTESQTQITSKHASSGGNNSRRKHMTRAVTIQWRALLLAFIFVVIFIIFWIVYQVELKKISKTLSADAFSKLSRIGQTSASSLWLQDWVKCLIEGRGQDVCAATIVGKVPSLLLMAVSDFIVSLTGVWLFIIFGARMSILYEWRTWFANLFCHKRRRGTNPDLYSNCI